MQYKQRVRLPRYVPDDGAPPAAPRARWSLGFIAWAALVVLSASSQSLAASVRGWLQEGHRDPSRPTERAAEQPTAPARRSAPIAAATTPAPPDTGLRSAAALELAPSSDGTVARRPPIARVQLEPLELALAPEASEPTDRAAEASSTPVEAGPRRATRTHASSGEPSLGAIAPAPAPPERPETRPPIEAAERGVAIARGSSGSSVGLSCEQARATFTDEIVIGRSVPADVPRERYASLLNNGSYFSHCAGAENRDLDICVAVQNGHAVGVTVTTKPRSRTVERCVAAAVSRLGFPRHPKLDVVRTSFR